MSALIQSFFLLLLTLAGLGLPATVHSAAMASGNITEQPQLRTATYDGQWSGTIRCLYDPGLWPEDECDVGVNFEIHGGDFLVEQIIRSKQTGESKKYPVSTPFQFLRLATNAVATSLNTGTDEDGTWVETWSFVMTLKDPNHMIVHWTRVVNNLDVPQHVSASKFSSVGMGELVRRNAKP